MVTYLSELGLPKEWSKKKKLPLYICRYFSNDAPGTDFEINADCERVYLTIDGAVTSVVTSLLNAGVEVESMKTGIFAIVEISYSSTELNSCPLYHDPIGNALDPDFDKSTLSFNITTNGKTHTDMTLSMTKVTEVTVEMVDGKYKISNISMRSVINTI
ncbi:MAG: hypothetical protein NC548_06100 [Lachnospiraceae bacterium]|nr:hypothetical protein [Lachnospiraceae bacterium]